MHRKPRIDRAERLPRDRAAVPDLHLDHLCDDRAEGLVNGDAAPVILLER